MDFVLKVTTFVVLVSVKYGQRSKFAVFEKIGFYYMCIIKKSRFRLFFMDFNAKLVRIANVVEKEA